MSVPISLAILTILGPFLFRLPLETLLPIDLLGLSIYLILLCDKNAYTDSEVLDMVRIPNAPTEIEDLLKVTTRGTNRLIVAHLIRTLGEKTRLSQTGLVDSVSKLDLKLSRPAITSYIDRLEKQGIVKSKQEYTKAYSLTRQGEWCYKAVKICFPKRYISFLVRHYLGLKKLPPFPENESQT